MPLWYWMLGLVVIVSFTIGGYMSSTARKMLGCMGLAVVAIACVALVLAFAGALLYGGAWALRQGWGH